MDATRQAPARHWYPHFVSKGWPGSNRLQPSSSRPPRGPSPARRRAAHPSPQGTARRCMGRKTEAVRQSQPQDRHCQRHGGSQHMVLRLACHNQRLRTCLVAGFLAGLQHHPAATNPASKLSRCTLPISSRGHAVAEEDAGVALGHHHAGPAGAQGHGRVLAARAAAVRGRAG